MLPQPRTTVFCFSRRLRCLSTGSQPTHAHALSHFADCQGRDLPALMPAPRSCLRRSRRRTCHRRCRRQAMIDDVAGDARLLRLTKPSPVSYVVHERSVVCEVTSSRTCTEYRVDGSLSRPILPPRGALLLTRALFCPPAAQYAPDREGRTSASTSCATRSRRRRPARTLPPELRRHNHAAGGRRADANPRHDLRELSCDGDQSARLCDREFRRARPHASSSGSSPTMARRWDRSRSIPAHAADRER